MVNWELYMLVRILMNPSHQLLRDSRIADLLLLLLLPKHRVGNFYRMTDMRGGAGIAHAGPIVFLLTSRRQVLVARDRAFQRLPLATELICGPAVPAGVREFAPNDLALVFKRERRDSIMIGWMIDS